MPKNIHAILDEIEIELLEQLIKKPPRNYLRISRVNGSRLLGIVKTLKEKYESSPKS